MLNQRKQFEILFDEMLAKYKVENILSDEVTTIFILESPHVEELKHGSPVSGLSGGTMTKALLGTENKTPLGIATKGNLQTKENPVLNKIGIMNICQIPMQLAAYQNKHVEELYGRFDFDKYRDFLQLLGHIRTNNKPTYKNEELNILQSVVLDRFKKTISELAERKLTVVPCGKTAQKFFALSEAQSDNWNVLKDVPHPSYNSWARESYKEKINEIIECLSIE